MIVAATEAELAPFRGRFGAETVCVVGGVGGANMAVSLLVACERHRPDRVVLVGVAGAVGGGLELCQGVVVGSDVQMDLGAVRDGRFVAFASQAPVVACPWIPMGVGFAVVCGGSVNTACSGIDYGQRVDIETMEGAAFFAAMERLSLPYLQLRTISNHITTPRSEWQIPQAIAALECFVPLISDFFAADLHRCQ